MKLVIFCFLGGSIALVAIVSIGYWAVNHFISELSTRAVQNLRDQLARETEIALKLFRDGMAEQIVNQENKSDTMAKLYANLIDLMRVGKEFSTGLAKGDLQHAEKMLVGIRNISESFAEGYGKQRLHLSDEICLMLDGFVEEQKGVVQQLEGSWRQARKDPAESKTIEAGIKQNWGHFEDGITQLMESMRTEFRKRQPSQANVIMKWLNQTPAPKDNLQPPAAG